MLNYLKYFLFSLLALWLASYFIPLPTASFDSLYAKVDTASKSLKEFRARPLKRILVNNLKWEYYTGGNGEKGILFIHGMGGAYDIWWNQIQFFETEYKVVSYTLPDEVHSLEESKNGLMAILDQEGIVKVMVIGTSMGGYIVQYLIEMEPSRIEKAVLGNTFPPNDLIEKTNGLKRKMIPLLPSILIEKLAERHLKKDILPTSENSELLGAFLLSVPFSKTNLANRYDILIDNFEPEMSDGTKTKIPKLILESDNDPMIVPELRSALKKIYPESLVYTFRNKGHFPYVNTVKEYNEVVDAFLKSKSE